MAQRGKTGERHWLEDRPGAVREWEPMDAASDWSHYRGDSSGGYGAGGGAGDLRDLLGDRYDEAWLSDPRRVFPERRSNRGRGPRNYRRSDERVREDVCELLTEDPHIDASGIDVDVANGEVTLAGTISSRVLKHRAEDLAASIPGVVHVQNDLRLEARAAVLMGAGRTTGGSGRGSGTGGGSTPTVF